MAYRVLLTDPLGPEGLARLREQPELEIVDRPGLAPAELRQAIRGFHALIVRSGTKVTADALAEADTLRVIGRAGIGVDNIDVDAATKKGIVVMNTPGGSNVTTAEHAITLLLALARNLPQAAAATRAGRWERNRRLGTEVCNKILGVIGLGNIGTIVAERALGLRMKVIASDPFVTAETAARLRVELVSLDELYVRSDFITIHTPLTAETRHLVNRDTLARMKRGVRLVNCARGGIVDEAALAEAIRGGHVAGAALDVLAQEPPPPDHPLLALEEVICTPHLGAATAEAQVNVAVAIAQQVADFFCRDIALARGPEDPPPLSSARREARSPPGAAHRRAPARDRRPGERRGGRAGDALAHRRRAARPPRPPPRVGRQLRQRASHRARAGHPRGRVAHPRGERLRERALGAGADGVADDGRGGGGVRSEHGAAHEDRRVPHGGGARGPRAHAAQP